MVWWREVLDYAAYTGKGLRLIILDQSSHILVNTHEHNMKQMVTIAANIKITTIIFGSIIL